MAGNSKHVRITGIPELMDKLAFMGGRETMERVSYRATFGPSKEMRDLARDNAATSTHQQSGALLRGFAMKRIRVGTQLGYTVGVRHGKRVSKFDAQAGDDPWYWSLLEFGTRYIAPKGFFRRAFAGMRSTAPQQIINAGRKAVLDSGNRALAKHGSGKK